MPFFHPFLQFLSPLPLCFPALFCFLFRSALCCGFRLFPGFLVTKGWAQARTSWWNMLQKVGEGADVASTVATYAAEANAAAK